MILAWVKGSNFQGYRALNIRIPRGALVIVGPNFSGKSTLGRLICWVLGDQFLYPNLKKTTKVMVRPGRVSGGAGGANGKKKRGVDGPPTIGQIGLYVPRFVNPSQTLGASGVVEVAEDLIIVTRVESKDGSSFNLRSEDGLLDISGDAAQQLLLSRCRIPDVGSQSDRIKLMLRMIWYGVGQNTPFFAASSVERKKIIEGANPFTLLPELHKDAGARYKSFNDTFTQAKESGSEQVGALRSKREDLARRVAPSIGSVALGVVSAKARGYLDALATTTTPLAEVERLLSEGSKTLAALDAAGQTMERLASQKDAFERLSTELAASGGETEASRLEQEAAELTEIVTAARTSLSEVADIRTKELALSAELQKSEQLVTELTRQEAELQALAHGISEKLEIAVGVLTWANGPVGSSAPSGEDAVKVAAAMEGTLQRLLALKSVDLKRALAALTDKKRALDSLTAESLAAAHEKKADELLASVGEFKTQLAELSTADAALSGLLGATIALSDKIKIVEAGQGEAGRLSVEVAAAVSLGHELVAASGRSVPAVSGEVAQGLSATTISKSLSAFEAATVKAAGGAAGAKTFVEKKVQEISSLDDEAQAAKKALQEAEAILQSGNDGFITLRHNQDQDIAQKATYERALSLTESAEASGETPVCKECGSELSKDHIESHLPPLAEKIAARARELAGEEPRVAGLREAKKRAELRLKAAEDARAVAEHYLTDLLGAASRLLSQCGASEAPSRAEAFAQTESDKRAAELTTLRADLVKKEAEAAAAKGALLAKAKEMATTLGLSPLGDDAKAIYKVVSQNIGAMEASRRAAAQTEKDKAQKLRSQATEIAGVIASAIDAADALVRAAGYQSNGEAAFLCDVRLLKKEIEDEKKGIKEAEAGRVAERKKLAHEISQKLDKLKEQLGQQGETNYETIRALIDGLDGQARAEASASAKKAQDIRAVAVKTSAARASYEATAASVPERLRGMNRDQLSAEKSATEAKSAELSRQRDALKVTSEIERLVSDVERLEKNQEAYEDRIDEMEDELAALNVIRGLLTPDGDTRTLALAGDVSLVVLKTNEYLKSLGLTKNIAIDLKLEKGEDGQPGVEIIFEVDGMSDGHVLPSESQRKIVGFCADFAIMKLRSGDGFMIVDEPETGFDDANKPRITQFLRNMSPQTIIITNTASAGFENFLSTDQIRSSVPGGVLTEEDFGITVKTKAKRPKKGAVEEADFVEDDYEDAGTI